MTKPYEVPFRVTENDSNVNKNGVKRMSKPMMEKRRRARINQCLMQLKEMVIDSGKQNIQNSKSKLEKADILELTVKYVQQLHQNRLQERKENSSENPQQILNDFVAGFAECAKQVEEFVCQTQPLDPIVVTSLSSHLNNCMNSLDVTHDHITYGVIRHTNQCCPPSPAPSTVSSGSAGAHHPILDMELSSISSADEDMPLNLSSGNRFPEHFNHPFIPGDDCVWRPW